jgi:hypothetical protein
MSSIYNTKPEDFLEVVVHDTEQLPGLLGVCAGFEGGDWRHDGLADYLLEWLPEFALTHREYEAYDRSNSVRLLKEAARNVYQTDKYGKRGEIGEILLHAIVRAVFNSEPAISKLYYKDAANDTVKGFDAVHIVEATDGLELWLGEVKFYGCGKKETYDAQKNRAIRDIVAELHKHTDNNYLKGEFAAIKRKLDPTYPHYEQLRALLGARTSLDKVFKRVAVPALIAYESDCFSGHSEYTEAYKEVVLQEAKALQEKFVQKGLPEKLVIHLLLLPMKAKKSLLDSFHRKLKGLQA